MVLHQDGHALCIEAMLDFENEFRFAAEKRFVLGALSFMCGLGKVLRVKCILKLPLIQSSKNDLIVSGLLFKFPVENEMLLLLYFDICNEMIVSSCFNLFLFFLEDALFSKGLSHSSFPHKILSLYKKSEMIP